MESAGRGLGLRDLWAGLGHIEFLWVKRVLFFIPFLIEPETDIMKLSLATFCFFAGASKVTLQNGALEELNPATQYEL